MLSKDTVTSFFWHATRQLWRQIRGVFLQSKNSLKRPYYKVYYITLFLFLLFCTTNVLSGQSKQELSVKRQELQREIDNAAKMLAGTKKNKAALLDQFYSIQRKINQRQQLITTLDKELVLSTQSIVRTTAAIESLKEDMNRLEQEYGEMLRQAYRNKQTEDELVFLFSATGLEDGLKRWQYIRRYNEYRQKQASLIVETRKSLEEKLEMIRIREKEQQQLLADATQQQLLLENELKLKDKIIKNLAADENRIGKLILQKKKAHRDLSKAIEKIISNQIKSRAAADRVNKAPSTEDNRNARPSERTSIKAITSNFKAQKGKLPWPVQKGIVTRYFGKQTHPIHKQITTTNNGIDIRATLNNKVSSIYEGRVVGLQFVPGFQNTLIIQHGEFYSVYSNLEKVIVKREENIKKGQLLGIAGVNEQTDFLEVHFEIWKGKQRLNPYFWLAKIP